VNRHTQTRLRQWNPEVNTTTTADIRYPQSLRQHIHSHKLTPCRSFPRGQVDTHLAKVAIAVLTDRARRLSSRARWKTALGSLGSPGAESGRKGRFEFSVSGKRLRWATKYRRMKSFCASVCRSEEHDDPKRRHGIILPSVTGHRTGPMKNGETMNRTYEQRGLDAAAWQHF